MAETGSLLSTWCSRCCDLFEVTLVFIYLFTNGYHDLESIIN